MAQPNSESGLSGIGVVDKSVTILAAVAAAPRALAELVETTVIPRATAHRLAVALETHRLLSRDDAGRFVLGPRIGELAASLPDPVLVAVGPVLTWVRDEVGESAQLYRRDGNERVCVAAAERTAGLRTTVPVGTRLPLSAGSGAQVLCAFADPAGLGETGFSVRSLVDVRRRGWAQSIAQREAGVASVSAPVLSPEGDLLGAISVSGPIDRLGRSPGQRIGPVLIDGARRVTAALAH